jgi:uroporphyrinogen III methyltransferase/synthase
VMPGEYRSEGVLQALAAYPLRGARILLPRADVGREILGDELRRAGAEVTEVIAYRTVVADAERDGDPDVYRMLLDRRIDVVTFTSGSAVQNFVKVFGTDAAPDLLKLTAVASIGPVTAEAAERLNIATSIMPSQSTIPALVEAIVEYVAKRQPAVEAT